MGWPAERGSLLVRGVRVLPRRGSLCKPLSQAARVKLLPLLPQRLQARLLGSKRLTAVLPRRVALHQPVQTQGAQVGDPCHEFGWGSGQRRGCIPARRAGDACRHRAATRSRVRSGTVGLPGFVLFGIRGHLALQTPDVTARPLLLFRLQLLHDAEGFCLQMSG